MNEKKGPSITRLAGNPHTMQYPPVSVLLSHLSYSFKGVLARLQCWQRRSHSTSVSLSKKK